jgi:nanoRNase/pAp phosphatase (c-di-AMP/oligoRNAs hydrolase)
MTKRSNMDLIITHAKCPDGFCAAFVAKKRFPEADIMPLNHGEPAPFGAVRGKDVLVLDFSWPNREDNIELHKIAKSLHVYDHHQSAQERLEGLRFVTFDMKRSGAGLAWDYLFGANTIHTCETHGEPRPWYVNYVEDRDLWNWAFPDSKAVNAYLMFLPKTIEAWTKLDAISASDAASRGSGILQHVERYVKEVVAEAQRGFLKLSDGVFLTAEVVNCPYMNCSEVGNVLAKQAAVGITWFVRADGRIQFSLRSEGSVDVSAIAKVYEGGGHMHAAGFSMPLGEGREFLDIILGKK